MSRELKVNRIACSGHGDCAELLPELIDADEWGYPIVAGGAVPPRLERRARRAVAAGAALALLLTDTPEETQSQPRAVPSDTYGRLGR
ncbi:MAG: ferredoxin [Actinomycetota bacterium]